MNLLDYTTTWVKGEVVQGKIMLFISNLLVLTAIFILRSQHALLRGTLIPLILIILGVGGYGGFQVFGRPAHFTKVKKVYQDSEEKAFRMEYDKAIKDDATYKRLKIVWTALIIISAILFLVFSREYFKGVSLGSIALFLSVLILDSTLHYRLEIYLRNLEKLL